MTDQQKFEEQEFDSWKTGDINTFGAKILHVYHRKIGRYIIYKSESSSIISFKANPKLHYGKKLQDFEYELSLIKGLLYKKRDREIFLPRIAAAYKCCFDEAPETTGRILEEVLKSITNHKTTKGRLEYLFGTVISGLIGISICFFISNFKQNVNEFVLFSVIFAILGGILSVSININKLEINIEFNSKTLHLITGISRTLIAIISGVLIYYFIDSGLILKSIINQENQLSIICVFASISGFLERLIPNIMEKIGDSTIKNISEKHQK